MTQASVEQSLRLEALRLASNEFGHHGSDIVVSAAEEYLDFLLGEEVDDETELPTHAPNGDPIVAAFSLSLTAVLNLSMALRGALAFAEANGIKESNEVSQFVQALVDECDDTLRMTLEAEV